MKYASIDARLRAAILLPCVLAALTLWCACAQAANAVVGSTSAATSDTSARHDVDRTCWQTVAGQTDAVSASDERPSDQQLSAGVTHTALTARLWLCAGDSLPVRHRQHLAAQVKPLVLQNGDGLWIIDPGATRQQGLALLAALQRSPAHAPKIAHRTIINSRALAEHVMASDILLQRWGPRTTRVLAWKQTRELMQRRCPACQKRLRRELGVAAMAGTHIRIPQALEQLQAQHTQAHASVPPSPVPPPLDAPSSDWLPFVAHAAHNAAIEEDAWFHAKDLSWVWTGMLLTDGIPDLQQGQVVQRIALLDTFARLDAQRADAVWLTSTGRVDSQRIAAERSYFAFWQTRAREAIDQGLGPVEALEKLRSISSPIVARDDLMKLRHELNLQRIIRQAEEALFN